jgi:hypothetical protein
MNSIIKIILICLLLIIAFCRNVYSQIDTIYTTVNADTVTIHHDRTHRNCASLFRFDVHLEDIQITVFEVDTTGEWANCLCYFDLSVKTGPLKAGEYLVDVYETDLFSGDTSYVGSTNFTIEGSGNTGDFSTISRFQSNCYETTNINQTNETIPENFTFSKPFPNPFNPVTNIGFSIPVQGYVILNVYNLLGQKVATLVNKNLPAGNYSVSWDGTDQESGIFLFRLKYENVDEVQKALLIK